MMGLLIYIQIFTSYFCNILLFLFPGIITYKTFAFVLSVFSVYLLGKEIIKNKFCVSKTFIWLLMFYSLIVIGYYFVTPSFYGYETIQSHEGQLMAIAGQIIPNCLFATFVAKNVLWQDTIKRQAPIVALLFMLVSFICIVNPNMQTTGGLASNDNGLNYQSASYLASYSVGLMEYYLLTKNDIQQYVVFNGKLGFGIAVVSILINSVTILLSGGRGGFVSAVLISFYTVVIVCKKSMMTVNNYIKGFIYTTVCFFIGYVVFGYTLNYNLSTSGIGRIIMLLDGGGDSGRSFLRDMALLSFQESPIWGHGFGSVFWELGIYSHNFFLDALVETGLIGTLVLTCLLIYAVLSIVYLIKIDFTDAFWSYIFISGLIMSMFSGYYLTHVSFWWAMFFIISKRETLILEKIHIRRLYNGQEFK